MMNQKNYSAAQLRKKKMMLVLPGLVLPFVTLAFWALGGGKGSTDQRKSAVTHEGLNVQLPDARLKNDKGLDKLSYYEQAAKDSARHEELLKKDPYFNLKEISGDSHGLAANDTGENEQKVYAKLAALDRELNAASNKKNEPDFNQAFTGKVTTNDADRLEAMMNNIQQSGKTADPEIGQLNGMLDKIIDIQHPERSNEQSRKNSLQYGERIFPVSLCGEKNNVSLLVSEKEYSSAPDTISRDSFYSIAAHAGAGLPEQNSIEAVIHETRALVNGSVVKFRLLTDVYIHGLVVPKGNFIYGVCTLKGERLLIDVSTIRFNQSILPVSLSVYDMDGLEGVFIPGAITRDVAKESTDRAIQGLALNSLNPSIGAQAAGAGIEAAKTLLNRKVKLVKVTIKAGYKVLLKSSKP